jgi:ribonucleoside-diphosphate reductase beta chain
MQKSFHVGSKIFVLDQDKAEAAFAAKKVINGRETMTFNLLPLKYQWAYDLYRKMKANHWEPEDIPMGKDIEQWRDEKTVSDIERWIIRMGIGYFSAAEGIVGDNIQHVVRELVTAPELKLVLGRHAHEENIHADSLLYMISSLGINPHECEAMFEDIPTIVKKNEFVTRTSRTCAAISTSPAGKQAAAGEEHLCLRPVHGGHAVLRPFRHGALALPPEQVPRHRPDVPLHAARRVQPHRGLPQSLHGPRWTRTARSGPPSSRRSCAATMREAVRSRRSSSATACRSTRRPRGEDFLTYIDYIADRRLEGCGLAPLAPGVKNPLPWLAEMMDIKKEQNFFEGRVTEYQKSSSLNVVHDDEL